MNSLLQTVQQLAPLIRQQAANTLDNKTTHSQGATAEAVANPTALLPELVAALHQQHVFRCLLPVAMGGAEQPLPEFLRALAACAALDASTSWCINQGAIAASLTCWLPEPTQQELWNEPCAAVASGAPVTGSAHWQGDNLVVSGHWMFGSGYHHATHIAGAVKLSGSPQWVMVFVPKAAVSVVDNWHTQGLRATGSVEFRLSEHTVPKAWVASMKNPCSYQQPLFRLPTGQCFALGFAALALGLAEAAVQDCIELAQHKRPRNSGRGLNEDSDAQRLLGQAQARLQAAQLLVDHHAQAGWLAAQQCQGTELITEPLRVNLRLAGTHGLREAAAVMQLAWQVAGTSGIYLQHPLHQRHQDMAVVSQHAQARVSHYAWLGRAFFGGAYEGGPLN